MVSIYARPQQWLLLIAFLCLSITSPAQTEKNAQFQQLQSLGQPHPDSALIVLKKAHAKAVLDNDNLAAGKSLQQMGMTYDQSRAMAVTLKIPRIAAYEPSAIKLMAMHQKIEIQTA